jgi:hypothetical protein
LLELPAEVRLMIYSLLIPEDSQDQHIEPAEEDDEVPSKPERLQIPGLPLPLLLANKLIYKELSSEIFGRMMLPCILKAPYLRLWNHQVITYARAPFYFSQITHVRLELQVYERDSTEFRAARNALAIIFSTPNKLPMLSHLDISIVGEMYADNRDSHDEIMNKLTASLGPLSSIRGVEMGFELSRIFIDDALFNILDDFDYWEDNDESEVEELWRQAIREYAALRVQDVVEEE